MEGLATTPASSYLFNTDPGCKKLWEEQGQLFHHLVAKSLYLSKCTRQDIQTAVAFLCTRVREPDTDNDKKLRKVMQYIRSTKNMTLTIELDYEAQWWVDSSYAVHPDMKSHTGIYMTLGKGARYTALCKQKLNTRSSMEQNWLLWTTQWVKYCGPGISSHTRTYCTNNDNLPRQQKYDPTSRKWKIFKFKENSPYKCNPNPNSPYKCTLDKMVRSK